MGQDSGEHPTSSYEKEEQTGGDRPERRDGRWSGEGRLCPRDVRSDNERRWKRRNEDYGNGHRNGRGVSDDYDYDYEYVRDGRYGYKGWNRQDDKYDRHYRYSQCDRYGRCDRRDKYDKYSQDNKIDRYSHYDRHYRYSQYDKYNQYDKYSQDNNFNRHRSDNRNYNRRDYYNRYYPSKQNMSYVMDEKHSDSKYKKSNYKANKINEQNTTIMNEQNTTIIENTAIMSEQNDNQKVRNNPKVIKMEGDGIEHSDNPQNIQQYVEIQNSNIVIDTLTAEIPQTIKLPDISEKYLKSKAGSYNTPTFKICLRQPYGRVDKEELFAHINNLLDGIPFIHNEFITAIRPDDQSGMILTFSCLEYSMNAFNKLKDMVLNRTVYNVVYMSHRE